MFPESIFVPNSVGNLFGHKDGANGSVPIVKSQKEDNYNGWSGSCVPPTKALGDSLYVRRFVVTKAFPGMCCAHPYLAVNNKSFEDNQVTYGPYRS